MRNSFAKILLDYNGWNAINHTNKYTHPLSHTHTHIHTHTLYIYIYIYIVKIKLLTKVECVPKAPFSIATTPMSNGGHNSFSLITPLYPWSVPYNNKCWASEYKVPFFESLVLINQGLNPGLSVHWWTFYTQG